MRDVTQEEVKGTGDYNVIVMFLRCDIFFFCPFECDHIELLMRALKRNVNDVWCTCSFKSAGMAGWGAARHHRGPGHEQRINPNNLRQVRGSIFLFEALLLVWFAGDMKSVRPSKDDEQH